VLYALLVSVSRQAAWDSLEIAALCAVIRYIKQPIVFTVDRGLIKAVLLFFLVTLLSMFFSAQPMAGAATFWDLLLCVLPLILATGFVKDRKQLTRILVLMASSIFITDLYAIWQGLHGNFRAAAFSLHPMTLAGYLIQMIPVLLVFFLEDQTMSKKCRIYFGMVLGVSTVALLCNGTRGAWIAVVLTLALYGVMAVKRKPKYLLGFVAILMVIGVIAINVPHIKARIDTISDNNYQSNSERLLMWHSAWNIFLDHPITGVGLGNYEKVYLEQYISPDAKERQGHAHNNFLQVLADRGIIGFLGLNYLFGYILYSSYRRYSKVKDLWGLAVFLVTISLLLQGLTEYNMGNLSVMRMYWFLLGLSHVSALGVNNIGLKDRELV